MYRTSFAVLNAFNLLAWSLAGERIPCARRHVSHFHLAPRDRWATEVLIQTLKGLVRIRCCYVLQCYMRNTTKIHTNPNFFRPLPRLLPAYCSLFEYFSPMHRRIEDGMVWFAYSILPGNFILLQSFSLIDFFLGHGGVAQEHHVWESIHQILSSQQSLLSGFLKETVPAIS